MIRWQRFGRLLKKRSKIEVNTCCCKYCALFYSNRGVAMLIVMLIIVLFAIAAMVELPMPSTQYKRLKERELTFKLREFRRAFDKYTRAINTGKMNIPEEVKEKIDEDQPMEEIMHTLKEYGFLRREYTPESFGVEGEWRLVVNRIGKPDFEQQDIIVPVRSAVASGETGIGKWYILATTENVEIRLIETDDVPPYLDYYKQKDVYGLSDVYGYTSKYGKKILNIHIKGFY